MNHIPHKTSCSVSGITVAAMTLILSSPTLMATPIGVGLGVGTLGPGISATVGINKKTNARFGINRFSQTLDLEIDEIEYEGEIELSSLTAIIDWHPWAGNFHLSGGVISNSNSATGTANAFDQEVTFGDTVVNLSELGKVKADVDFEPIVGYLGLGWGNAIRNTGFSFFADAGVMFQGDPRIDISVEDLDENSPISQEDIDIEIEKLKDDVSDTEYPVHIYPVLTLGFAYSF